MESRNKNSVLHSEILYQPEHQETRLHHFREYVERKYNVSLMNFWELREWSVENYAEFWECVWQYFNVKSSKPYTQILIEGAQIHKAVWFPNSIVNYAENILRFRDSQNALICLDKDNNLEYVTFQQLYDEVAVYIRALEKHGIKKGDYVAGYLKQVKEAVYAHLATISIGAVWAAVVAHSGSQGALIRLAPVKPKIVFTLGNYYFNGVEVDMQGKIGDIVAGIPSLEKVVVVPLRGTENHCKMNINHKCISLREFLGEEEKKMEVINFVQVPYSHPICANFTSGTTGVPKGIIHNFGVLLSICKDFGLSLGLAKGDVLLVTQMPGWVVWNRSVGALALGVTLLLYDGQPMLESPSRFYDLVDRFGITSCLLSPMLLQSALRKGHLPGTNSSLKSLKSIISIGSVLMPELHKKISEKFKNGVFVAPMFGMTEFGFASGLDLTLPVHAGELQGFSLGIDVRLLDGQSRMDSEGGLVILNPCPVLPAGLVDDPEEAKVAQNYLDLHPGFWASGDTAVFNPKTKGITLYGRSDDCISCDKGRFWSSEFESVLLGLKGVDESVCMCYHKTGELVLLLKLARGFRLTERLKADVCDRIRDYMYISAVPDVILEAPAFPHNHNGKKLHRLVSRIINKQSVTTFDVANASCLEYFHNLDLDN